MGWCFDCCSSHSHPYRPLLLQTVFSFELLVKVGDGRFRWLRWSILRFSLLCKSGLDWSKNIILSIQLFRSEKADRLDCSGVCGRLDMLQDRFEILEDLLDQRRVSIHSLLPDAVLGRRSFHTLVQFLWRYVYTVHFLCPFYNHNHNRNI